MSNPTKVARPRAHRATVVPIRPKEALPRQAVALLVVVPLLEVLHSGVQVLEVQT